MEFDSYIFPEAECSDDVLIDSRGLEILIKRKSKINKYRNHLQSVTMKYNLLKNNNYINCKMCRHRPSPYKT